MIEQEDYLLEEDSDDNGIDDMWNEEEKREMEKKEEIESEEENYLPSLDDFSQDVYALNAKCILPPKW